MLYSVINCRLKRLYLGSCNLLRTVCPRSSDPFYIVSYYIKWVTTSWSYSMFNYQKGYWYNLLLWGLGKVVWHACIESVLTVIPLMYTPFSPSLFSYLFLLYIFPLFLSLFSSFLLFISSFDASFSEFLNSSSFQTFPPFFSPHHSPDKLTTDR